MSEIILKVDRLTKDFGSFRAVDGISFEVPKGKIVGFLGPNGAGKTTTIHMLLGITTPTSGSISYFGQDFYSHRSAVLQRINFTSAFNTLQDRITILENLSVFADLYAVKNFKNRISDLIEYFDIGSLLHKRYRELSTGQKTRVNLVKSLINDPDLILMDEPTASLDPDIADKTMSFIEKLKKDRDLTLLYTSHNMKEITRICDEVIFLDHGKIVAQDTPLGLTKRIKIAKLRLTFERGKEIVEKYLRTHKQKFSFEDSNHVSIDTEEGMIPKIIFGITKTNIYVTDIEIEKPSLEDVFLQIARREI